MKLLVLPKYVFLPILSEWLEIIDIGFLDTALCSYELRPIFLTHVNSRTICLKESCVLPIMTKLFMNWINMRDVALDFVDISGELRQYDIVPFILNNAPLIDGIRARRFKCDWSTKLLDYLRICCSNISLFFAFQTFNDRYFLAIPLTLTTFQISHCCRINISKIAYLIRNCTVLKNVSLSHCQLIDDEEIAITGSSHTLESLEIVHCSSRIEKSRIVAHLVDQCPLLSRITAIGGRNDEECLFPSDSNRWNKLTYVDWSDSFILINSSLRYFITDCPLLTCLNLKNCCRIRDTSLLTIAESCPLLQNLTVGLSSRYKHDHPFCHISDQGLMGVLNSCKSMTHWCIYDCSVTVAIVRAIVTQSGDRLKSLLLFSELIHVNSECLADLVHHCKISLTALALNGLDNVSNQLLADLTSSTVLKELSLLNSREITVYLSPVESLACSCTALVKLHIVEDLVTHKANISRACFYLIAQQCKLLEDLSIANSHQINDLSVIHFTTYCSRITNLCLLNCWNVVGDCLQEVCRVYGKRLSTLSLVNNNKSQGFSDAMLMNTLPRWSHHISLLDLSHNISISSKCIARLLRFCGDRLTSLNLSHCIELTSSVGTSVALYCPCLSYLYLDYCPHISDEAIFHILQRCQLLLKLSMKGRLGGHPGPDGTTTATVGGATPLFWLSDLHSLYPDIVVT